MNKENQISSYETVFICDLSKGEELVRSLIEKFTGLISSTGTIVSVNEWGKRRLAYPINDMKEGYYVLVTFKAPHDLPAELERVFNITEGIMRSLVIRIEDADAVAAANPVEVVIEDEEAGNAPKVEKEEVKEVEETAEETEEEAVEEPAEEAEEAVEETAEEAVAEETEEKTEETAE